MTSSREVFEKRKAGELDEAYQMALQRMGAPDKNEWDDKAFGWCLIDLMKRDAKSGAKANLAHYRQQLEAIEVPSSDDVLTKQRQFAIALCNPTGQLANEARQLSKSGEHKEAATLYRRVLDDLPNDREVCNSLGWELYRISKKLLAENDQNILPIKQNLNEYLKLNVEKPSLLHSCILQLASKLVADKRLSMMAFSRLWELDYLRPDDWERFVTDDKKELPSLAEKVIQQASKEAGKGDDHRALVYVLPYLEKAIAAYADNIWLNLNKAKVLLMLGRNDDALNVAIEVARAKSSDYWAWELLGDISITENSDLSLSCFSKALLVSSDDRFSGKVRLKLAKLMIERSYLAEAKYEIDRLLLIREKEGYKIPVEVESFVSQSWYLQTSPTSSNDEFYRQKKAAAEDLLYSQLPWIEANVGDIFTLPGKENRPKRRLYLKTSSEPLEAVIPENKFSIKDAKVGHAIRVKGEWDERRRFQVYLVSRRETDEVWDIFIERVGVIDHVNHEKKMIHFLVDTNVSGIVPFSELDADYHAGDAILVKLSKYANREGPRYRVISARKSEVDPPQALRKDFCESVRVNHSGLGFTDTDIFIPPNLVKDSNIQNESVVNGIALLTYNKKRSEWGWKAITAHAL